MKKLILLLICILTAVSLFGCGESDSQGLKFELKDDGTFAVSVGNATELSEIVIPSTYLGKPVSEIATDGFSSRKNGDLSLTKIIIPDSVTVIGDHAFYGCSGLTEITLPASVTSIGSSAFGRCTGLTEMIIPDGVISIGASAFGHCTSLESVTIPDSITNIGSSAFENCSSLEDVYITDVEKWCNISFAGSYAIPLYYANNLYLNGELITDLVIGNGVETIPSYAFSCNNIITATITDGVTNIATSAFENCIGLTDVTIPDSVTNIGPNAFYNCSSLTEVTIPDSVVAIGFCAFNGCSELTTITVPFVGATKDGKKNTHFGYIFGASKYSEHSSHVPKSLKSVIITNSATVIDEHAFRNCANLESVTVGKYVTRIGIFAFYGCSELKSITFVRNIGWFRTISYTSSGLEVDVKDPSTNANNLKKYYGNYWYRL